ncbi:MAG: hypothetical protein QOJ73_7554 [Streptosporangiaceae bacterium]|nr:hypothetical protein [Streptosporangiaceae bacterium]
MGPDSKHAEPGGSLVRASDADRDRAVDALAAASAEGRLSLEEYSERSEAALIASTLGDLASLTADLPAAGLPAAPHGDAAAIPEEITAVLGNESRKGPWVVPPHLAVRSVLGDCHLEMQHAVIGQHVTTIDATVRFGTVTIFVPDGINVRMTGRAVLGAKSSDLGGEPQPGAPVIVVRCDVLCGAVTVRRPDWLMRRRARRASAASGSGNVCPVDDPA